MNGEVMISVANFSKYPSGRDDNDGSFNGKKFRQSVLKPALDEALRSGNVVCVSLKGVMSFGSSFLEEVFGGLVRVEGFDKATLKKVLRIDPSRPNFVRHEKAIWNYINGA